MRPNVVRTCKCGRVVRNDFTIICPKCKDVLPAEPDKPEKKD